MEALQDEEQEVTWNDGHVNANIPAVLYKLQEDLHIIEELCHNDLASSIDLHSSIDASKSELVHRAVRSTQ